MSGLSRLTKTELIEKLRSLGQEPENGWTSVEIRSRIGELTQRDRSLPLGVNTNSTRTELSKKCEELGVNVTDQMTRGQLMRKLRETQEDLTRPTDDDVITFGKYNGRKYREAPKEYIDWARTTVEQDPLNCSRQLRRLVRWADQGRSSKGGAPPVKSHVEIPVETTAPRKRHSATSSQSLEPTASPQMERVELALSHILDSMTRLDVRIGSLETREMNMDLETTRSDATGASFVMTHPIPPADHVA